MHFTGVSQPCNAKNTVNTTVFDSMDGGGVEPTTSGLQAARGGGVKSDSIRKSAFPAPGIFLAKARGTPASIASFREKRPVSHPDNSECHLPESWRRLTTRVELVTASESTICKTLQMIFL